MEREAIIITGMPVGELGEDALRYAVGQPYNQLDGNVWRKAGIVSRITVTDDLPGLHCNMERVRVFDGDHMIFEAPLHSLEGIVYAAPAKAEGKS